MRKDIIQKLFEARDKAYAPYSGFKVGAVIETENGIYTGANIENASYGLTLCAEAVALSALHMSGDTSKVKSVFVCGAAKEYVNGCETLAPLCTPCGACRQRLRERCAPDTDIACIAPSGRAILITNMERILPDGFGPDNLSQEGSF